MPKVSPIQSSFNGGEVSPLLLGRVDFDAYKNSLARCLNHVPYVQGGLTRRPATYFSDEVKDSSKATRVVAFKFSTTQAYIIEFGDMYVRFKRNNGPVTETGLTITGITRANPAVLTYTGTDPANGNHMDLAGIVGMTELNGRRATVANVNAAANTFELSGVDSTAFTAYSSGGTASRVYTVATPYAEADLFQLKFTQSADVLYITHPSYAPRKLTRTGHTAWTLTAITFLDGPYLTTNPTATTITPSATTGAITLTASAAIFTALTDVGRVVRIKHGGTWGYARITFVGSPTFVNADVVNAFGATTASASWRLGLYSDTTGYPSCVTFFEDRLFFGGSSSDPQRVDGSKSGDYENFAPTATDGVVAADNAVAATMNSDDVQVIRWMKGDEKALLVGTAEGEWIIRPSSQSEALSPTNITAKQSTAHGSTNTQAVRAGKAVLFIQKSGRKIRELAYVYEVDGFRAPDMTILSEHITRTGLKELAYQQDPQSIVWAARNDGVLAGMTYERDQKVLGWHKHELGGYSDAGHTETALVESVAVIPAADGTRDELWMVVKRYINGGVKRYVEYMTKLWEQDDTQANAFYVDCGLTYNGSATTSISGLHHLAGETIQCLVDGATHPDVTVTANGGVTLARAGSVVQLGYNYNSDGQMLRLEAGAADGTAQGKTQRTHKVVIRVLDSLGLKVGPSFDNLTRLVFRTSANNAGQAVPLFTGDVGDFTWEGDYSNENYICWRWDQPLPGTVLAIMPQLHTQDR
ncbi:hypothetical protein [Nitrosovibrio sp. Nv4]|uniref:hypothetical protein n=1 Tax=Nitrosovibrio sp. Nv4 TaxID=1945880 RepID=UPI000BD1D32A|nr:hypothetical protein [Nitrosovibrio sp. Nv4]SOD41315.1 hypothetical protein SAMN06298226_1610 [Nitrosovibrio sp. Nv4]